MLSLQQRFISFFVAYLVAVPTTRAGEKPTVKKVSGIDCTLYTLPYQITSHGMVALSNNLAWKVYDGYRGVDKSRQSFRQSCVNLTLTDTQRTFLQVIIKMDDQTAQRLLDRLCHVLDVKQKHPLEKKKYKRPIKKISGMECVLFTKGYAISQTGKIALPADTQCRVYSAYLGQSQGKRTIEDCVLLVLQDKHFWPLVAKMDTETATKLKDDLGSIIRARKHAAL